MGVEEVGVDGSNNPIEYTGETSRPSAAHDGNAAATQIAAAIAARIIFVFMFLPFLLLLKIGRVKILLLYACCRA